MIWWIWIIAGFCALGLEMFIPTDFFLVFVGVAGVITGVLTVTGLVAAPALQWGVFAVLALGLLLLAKKPLVKHLMKNVPLGTCVSGDSVLVEKDIAPGEVGQGKTRGTVWKVRNESGSALKGGNTYRVGRTDGITLVINE